MHEVGGHADGGTRGDGIVAILDRVMRTYSGEALGNAVRETER